MIPMRLALAAAMGAFLALAAPAAGESPLKECPDCPELAVIPAGGFTIGSPANEVGRYDNEGPQHAVRVPAFALGRYPVTVAEFAVFVTETGYAPGPCNWPGDYSWQSPGIVQSDRKPVVCVSWSDAQAYLSWLNGKVKNHSAPYRLPSEAEWEYAARAGTSTARWWGEEIGSGKANCNGCGSAWDNLRIAPAGSFGPNPFGLYDMLGNVWQWTADCWADSYDGAPADSKPRSTGACDKRVLRGGSWSNLPSFIRSAARNRGAPDDRDRDYSSYAGFRVARTIP